MTFIQKMLIIIFAISAIWSMKNNQTIRTSQNKSELSKSKAFGTSLRQPTFINMKIGGASNASIIDTLVHKKKKVTDTVNFVNKLKKKQPEKPPSQLSQLEKLESKYQVLIKKGTLSKFYKFSNGFIYFKGLMENMKGLLDENKIDDVLAERLNVLIYQLYSLIKTSDKRKKMNKNVMESWYHFNKEVNLATVNLCVEFLNTNNANSELTDFNKNLSALIEVISAYKPQSNKDDTVRENITENSKTDTSRYNYKEIRERSKKGYIASQRTKTTILYNSLKSKVNKVVQSQDFLALIPKSHLNKPIHDFFKKLQVYLIKPKNSYNFLVTLEKVVKVIDLLCTKSEYKEFSHSIMVKKWYLFNKTIYNYVTKNLEKLIEMTNNKEGHIKGINESAELLLDEVEDLELFNDGWHDLIYLWERDVQHTERVIDRTKLSKQSKVVEPHSFSRRKPLEKKRRFNLGKKFPRSRFLQKAFEFNRRVNKITQVLERQNKFKNLTNQLKNTVVKMYKSPLTNVFDQSKDNKIQYEKKFLKEIKELSNKVKKQLKRVKRDYDVEMDLEELENNLDELTGNLDDQIENDKLDIVSELPDEEINLEEDEINNFIDINIEKLDQEIRREIDPITDIDIQTDEHGKNTQVDLTAEDEINQADLQRVPELQNQIQNSNVPRGFNSPELLNADIEDLSSSLLIEENVKSIKTYDHQTKEKKKQKKKVVEIESSSDDEEELEINNSQVDFDEELQNSLTDSMIEQAYEEDSLNKQISAIIQEINLMEVEEGDNQLLNLLIAVKNKSNDYLLDDVVNEEALDEFNQNLKDLLTTIRDMIEKIKDEEFDNDKQDIETLGFQLEEILITFESVPGINNAYLNELRQAIEDLKNYLNLNLQPQESQSDIEEKPKKRVIMVVEMVNCAQCLDYIDINDFMNLDDE